MLIFKFALKYFNLEICIDKSHITSFVINNLNFCYIKYTNVNKVI